MDGEAGEEEEEGILCRQVEVQWGVEASDVKY